MSCAGHPGPLLLSGYRMVFRKLARYFPYSVLFMKSELTWKRGALGVSRATRLVVLQLCPGAEQPCSAESRVMQLRDILHCSHCSWHFHGSGHHSPSPQYCFFYTCSGPCFLLTISLLPLKQLMWSLTQAMLRVWGNTQVPGEAGGA